VASVLETFFVKLGFEIDEPAFEKAQDTISEFGKSLLALGGIAISFAGLTELTLHTAEAMAQVELLAERSGLATETIAGMTRAARDFDVSADQVQNTLENVNLALGGIINGTAPRMTRVFKMLGFSAKDAAGQQKDVVTFLGDVAEKIKGLSAGAQQQVLSRLGISPNMVLMLRNGREAFLDLYNTAKGGIPWKDEDFKRSEEFTKSWRNAKAALGAVGTAIGLELMPIFKHFADAFNTWWKGNGKAIIADLRAGVETIADRIDKADAEFRKASGGVDLLTASMRLLLGVTTLLLAKSVYGWAMSGVSGLVVLGEKLEWAAMLMGEMGVKAFFAATGLDAEAAAAETATVSTIALTGWGLLLMAVIAALAAVIYLLVDDFIAWRKGGDSLIGRFQKNYPQAFAIMRKAVLLLRDEFLELWNAIKSLMAVVGPPLLFLLKWLLIIAAVVVGVIVAAFIFLAYTAVMALTKVLTWLTKLTTFLLAWRMPALKAVWAEIEGAAKKAADGITKAWGGLGSWFKGQWNEIAAGAVGAWNTVIEWLRSQWDQLTGDMTAAWQTFADTLQSIWDGIMGWLDPILTRIEGVFGFLSKIGGGVMSVMAGAPTGAMPALAMAGVAPGMPSSITNAQRTQTVNHNTDVRVTQNIQTSDPQAAGNAAADKLNATRQSATRNAQSRHL
jgi:minor tail protein